MGAGAPGVYGADKPGGCERVPCRLLLLGTVICGVCCPLPVLISPGHALPGGSWDPEDHPDFQSVDSKPSFQFSVTGSSPLDTQQAHLTCPRSSHAWLVFHGAVGVSQQKRLRYRPDRALEGRSPRRHLHHLFFPHLPSSLFMARGGGEKYLLGA